MDPKNPRWLAADLRRARSALMWKIIVSVVTAAALGTVLVFTWLDRRDAKRGESSTTRTTSADVRSDRAVNASSGASMTDTSSGISPRAYGAAVPIPPAAQERAPGTHDSSTGAAAAPSAFPPPVPAPAAGVTVSPGRPGTDSDGRGSVAPQGQPPENKPPVPPDNGAASPGSGTPPQGTTAPAAPEAPTAQETDFPAPAPTPNAP